jgi:hypothetical protein
MQESSGAKASSNAIFDVRGVKAPDDILAILKKASDLPTGSSLEFQIDSNPFQLYDLLQQRGFFLEMVQQTDGTFLGLVKARDTSGLDH